MPTNIKSISDLRNYSEVLRDMAVGAPVFLTKNGRGKYAILDIQDFKKSHSFTANNAPPILKKDPKAVGK